MGKTATLNLRVKPEVKAEAEEVLDQLGLSMSTAIELYLKQIAMTRGIPFSLTLPKESQEENIGVDGYRKKSEK